MPTDALHLSADALTHLQDLAVIRGENPMVREFIGHGPELGLVSGVLISVDADDLETVAREIDRAAGVAGPSVDRLFEEMSYGVMQDTIDTGLVLPVLTGESVRISEDFPAHQVELLQSVVRTALPEASRPLFMTFPNLAGRLTFDTLNFLTSGDTEARRQAIETYPMVAEDMVQMPKFRAPLDARTELAPIVGEHLELDAAQMRIYARYERAIAELTFAPGNEQGSLAARKAISLDPRRVPPLASIRNHAVLMARRIRMDQLPAAQSGDAPAAIQASLRFSEVRVGFSSHLNVGERPFDRITSRIRPGDWEEATERLKLQRKRMGNVLDSIRSTTQTIASAILVDMLRRDEAIDMDRISAAAHRVLSDEPVEEDDAVYLSTFLMSLADRSYAMTQVGLRLRQVIGDGASLKSLSEADTRWHHVQEQIGNELMATEKDIAWTALVGRRPIDRLVGRELVSSEALLTQGRREEHCVGSYSRHVLEAKPKELTLIFSIETEAGEILSTAEISGLEVKTSAGSPGYAWTLQQHKARRNGAPGPEASRAADQLVAYLGGLPYEEVRAYISAINRDTANLKDKLARVLNAYGGNICEPRLPERALAAIESTLPKPLRELTISDWTARLADTDAKQAEKGGTRTISRLAELNECARRALVQLARDNALETCPQ
ncbi:hypothetical protein [Roseivivax halodurans]|nr:hypothetical protein [Roseivivax halodurans]